MGAVLDTNIILELGRKGQGSDIFEKISSIDNTFYITSITKFEVLIGFPRKDELMWLELLPELPFDGKCAEVASYIHRKLRERGTPLSFRDLFIASIAIANNLALITMDEDFTVLRDMGFEIYLIKG
ncbi:twitching motility protein PilT [Thermococcus chitonophagus]|uniref:Twitching motility protein PilT n=1 Tax=Thermococcus chitonophagus TaxID=54262 RepID=A0A160VSP3_9EURY|nr:type II toxin-antitoxin system VapC family toxin [Thermococcus chitonophagus]ASJ17415.1 twitching motility protein PilT [Thermococcus chitonophagus]CUX78055.1 VapC toxin protein [Thermococcus chitonophagus]